VTAAAGDEPYYFSSRDTVASPLTVKGAICVPGAHRGEVYLFELVSFTVLKNIVLYMPNRSRF